MADFLELGLEVCDRAIDKGFDKLPDRIVSPLGADIPHPHIFHRNNKGELVDQRGDVQRDNAKNREKEESATGSVLERDRGVGRKPSRSATMPTEYSGRPRGQDSNPASDESNYRDNRQRRNDEIYRRPPPRRDGYGTSTRPPITSRRSQSYPPKREHRRRERTRSPSPSDSGIPLSESKTEKILSNPYAVGIAGALAGGLIANQAGKASGLDKKRRSKSHSSSRRRSGEGDEAIMTLAGMLIGGVTAAYGSDKFKKFRGQKAEERRSNEKSSNSNGRLAQEDWNREHHEEEAEISGWARSQADVYPEQIKEARRWQAQVDAGERERERLRKDDVVVLENTRRRSEQPQPYKVYRQERIYQPQPDYDTREIVERVEEPLYYQRRSRRRSVDEWRNESPDRKREMNGRDNNYDTESRQRDR